MTSRRRGRLGASEGISYTDLDCADREKLSLLVGALRGIGLCRKAKLTCEKPLNNAVIAAECPPANFAALMGIAQMLSRKIGVKTVKGWREMRFQERNGHA
jgi:hypothetical protein